MKVLLFGASGMVGQGVLRECLLDKGVERVITIARRPIGTTHAKLREFVQADVTDLAPAGHELAGPRCLFLLPRRHGGGIGRSIVSADNV